MTDVAESASGAARKAYDQSERYVRQARERYPEAGRYHQEGRQAVSQRVIESPWLALFVAGAARYALAWMIHGTRGGQSGRVPDFARTRPGYSPIVRSTADSVSARPRRKQISNGLSSRDLGSCVGRGIGATARPAPRRGQIMPATAMLAASSDWNGFRAAQSGSPALVPFDQAVALARRPLAGVAGCAATAFLRCWPSPMFLASSERALA